MPVYHLQLYYNYYNYIDTRLHDFVIYTTNTMPTRDQPAPSADAATSTICGRYPGVAPRAAMTSVQCDDVVTGRYVVIQIPGGGNYLTLCEVEIYCKYLTLEVNVIGCVRSMILSVYHRFVN